MSEELSALSRLTAFVTLNEDELVKLARIARPARTVGAKTVLVKEGDCSDHCFLLLDGWIGSFTTSREGRHSINRIHMAGDLLGNTSMAFRENTETLIALCPVTVAAITCQSLGSLFATHPRIGALLYLVALEERVRQTDWTCSLLRLEAAGRIAALFLELHDRHAVVSTSDTPTFHIHLTQYDIADLTGLTATHTNRVLQRFRQQHLIDLHHHTLSIIDRAGLERLADRPSRQLADDIGWFPEARDAS